MNRNVLIVDDDALLRDVLSAQLTGQGLTVSTASSAGEALRLISESVFDLVFLDQKLPDGRGADLCPAILAASEHAKIIFMTAFPSLENAVSAVRAGAYDYLVKPFALEEVELALERALRLQELEGIEQLHRRQQSEDARRSALAGLDAGLAEVDRLAAVAAAASAPVLITGETGTGKSLLARHIHARGPRRERAFVAINTAALPESLADAELFGHERGAFTNALSARRGCFELAHGGTLLLDEIGAMPLALQAKLLSAVEEGQVRRLGAEASRRIDVRLIAATNARLEDEVAARRFREDLLYRLSVLRIDLPPLRERAQDIPALCRAILDRLGCGAELDGEEIAQLRRYPWPGNVRELQNVLERAVLLGQGRDLRPSRFLAAARPTAQPASEAAVEPLEVVEARHLRQALAACGGNRTRAAKMLGIGLSTLKRRLAMLAGEPPPASLAGRQAAKRRGPAPRGTGPRRG